MHFFSAQLDLFGRGGCSPHFAYMSTARFIIAPPLLLQTTMRSEIGKLSLDKMFEERDNLNTHIVAAINSASEAWGIACMRYEIRDITPPRAVRAAMEMQAEAERRKRALILDSEGEREAEVGRQKKRHHTNPIRTNFFLHARVLFRHVQFSRICHTPMLSPLSSHHPPIILFLGEHRHGQEARSGARIRGGDAGARESRQRRSRRARDARECFRRGHAHRRRRAPPERRHGVC